MILELLILLFCAWFAYSRKMETVLLTVLFFLPFHFFLKSLLGAVIGKEAVLFSFWKELMLGILLLRILWDIYRKKISYNTHYPLWIILLYLAGAAFLFWKAPDKGDALVSLKSYAFPLLCFFIGVHLPFVHIDTRKAVSILSSSALIVFVMAHMEHLFFPVAFGNLYHIIDQVLPDGKILYTQSAYTIITLNRMYGPAVGPNELGVYTSLVLFVTSAFFFTHKPQGRLKWILLSTLVLGISTLMQTYSRVSWGMFLFASFLFFVFIIKKWKPIIGFGLYVLLSVGIMTAVNKNLRAITVASITGNEASARTRSTTFEEGTLHLRQKPLGFGMGTVQYSSVHPRAMHTEIWWWLVVGENGIVFGIVLLLVYLTSIFQIYRYKKSAALFGDCMPPYLLAVVVGGFASVILFDPVFQVFLWTFCGWGMNRSLQKKDYE